MKKILLFLIFLLLPISMESADKKVPICAEIIVDGARVGIGIDTAIIIADGDSVDEFICADPCSTKSYYLSSAKLLCTTTVVDLSTYNGYVTIYHSGEYGGASTPFAFSDGPYHISDLDSADVTLADNAITAAKIATDAITSDELATTAVTEIENAVYANRADYMADVSGLSTAAELAKALDSLAKIIDTLESQDNWIAQSSELSKVLDSLGKVIDSLEAYDGWVAQATEVSKVLDSLGKVIDSLESQDDWVSSFDESTDSVYVDISTFNAAFDNDTALVDFLRAAIGGGITDGQMAAIGDTVWQKLANAYASCTGCFGDVLFDSIDAAVSSAGGVASISDADMAAIIDTLFKRLVSDTLTNTYLSTLLRTAGASGGGPYTIYVRVIDTSGGGSAGVPNMPVFAYDTLETLTKPFLDITDASGYAEIAPGIGYWKFIFNGYGYQQIDSNVNITALDTIVLSTYTSSANKTTVYGVLRDSRGNPYDSAEVRFELVAVPEDSTLTYNDTVIVQRFVYDTADINGYWSLATYSNDNLSDSSYYQIFFRDKSGDRIRRESGWLVHIPDSTSINFASLTKWRQ